MRLAMEDFENPNDCYVLPPPAYDDKGNLYVQPVASPANTWLCELPAKGNTLEKVTLRGHVDLADSTIWDGCISLWSMRNTTGTTIRRSIKRSVWLRFKDYRHDGTNGCMKRHHAQRCCNPRFRNADRRRLCLR